MPKGYIYAEIEVIDPELMKTYRPPADASIAAFGGRFLVRGGDAKVVLEGDAPPPRSVLIEFDSPERAMAFYNSPQYQSALQIRLRAAKSKVIMWSGPGEG
jgi:uncharacterized protein (DUF1330 family)